MRRPDPTTSAPGTILADAVTGARALVHRAVRGLVRAELWLPVGAGAAQHAHPGEERLQVAAGTLMLGTPAGMELLGPGAEVRLAPGDAHEWCVAGGRRVHVLAELRGAGAFGDLVAAVWGRGAGTASWSMVGRSPGATDPSAPR